MHHDLRTDPLTHGAATGVCIGALGWVFYSFEGIVCLLLTGLLAAIVAAMIHDYVAWRRGNGE